MLVTSSPGVSSLVAAISFRASQNDGSRQMLVLQPDFAMVLLLALDGQRGLPLVLLGVCTCWFIKLRASYPSCAARRAPRASHSRQQSAACCLGDKVVHVVGEQAHLLGAPAPVLWIIEVRHGQPRGTHTGPLSSDKGTSLCVSAWRQIGTAPQR